MIRFYLITSSLIAGFYGVSQLRGWELATPPRQVMPAGVRQSPGGYRSFHFWHTGWQGGK
jgi:hypothetical protein